ncbi:hypothetical protein [Ornithinimicrobium pekingense]|uniref:DUF308 domain-containing protein n=1 Tax=Ornithinimicrobium pekingense TaxID=384677 RepID=A0ABQ2F8M4_9MICO|nr:hypothetical protein [Ornithinimicrobium pekingense]GGK69422.1 hypothetical protein GCM10011509_17260 [Ornithinimicrobium pekingense]
MTDRGPHQPDDRDDVDRRFREIVAGLEAPPPAGAAEGEETPTGTAVPDGSAPEDTAAPPDPTSTGTPAGPAPNPWPSHLGAGTPHGMATDHRSYEPPEEDDHFVPPRPDPLPAGDLHFWAILTGLVVGPLLVFLSAIVPVLDRAWTFVGAALTIAGFVLLVLRQPRHRRDDDWGARV